MLITDEYVRPPTFRGAKTNEPIEYSDGRESKVRQEYTDSINQKSQLTGERVPKLSNMCYLNYI